MPRFVTGTVVRIVYSGRGMQRLLVDAAGEERKATAFTAYSGDTEIGDRVVLNTTAVDLGLGTGGQDFVLWNLEHEEAGSIGHGHILKLRYTPWQIDTLAAEAPESPHHAVLSRADSIEELPVVACGLHSQVAAVTALIKHRRADSKIVYVMTDGAALPMAHSDLVETLRERRLLDATISTGHAFGGDLECVNVFSGLVAAKHVLDASVAVVSVGPGIVGTGTLVGHTGMDQGQSLSAAGALGGVPIAALRISFVDPRDRHRGVSHHSLAALRLGAMVRCVVAVPKLDEQRLSEIIARLDSSGIRARHDVRIVDASDTLEALAAFGIEAETMGRKADEDPDFFQAAGAAGAVALEMIR